MWTAISVGLVDVDSNLCWAAGCEQQTFLLGCWMWTANISIGLVDGDNNFCWAGGCGQQPFLLGWWMWTAINVGLVVEDSRHLHSAGITVCLAGYYIQRTTTKKKQQLVVMGSTSLGRSSCLFTAVSQRFCEKIISQMLKTGKPSELYIFKLDMKSIL